ncbi:MAG TPA: DUF5672 family protein [Casimicrobiaceae bacterium]|nr:DUF5672 family protein [Casimicrobiaceae bacterium]
MACQTVTLCAVDSVTPRLALRALEASLEGCDFGEAILFTSDVEVRSESVRVFAIEALNSRSAYSAFVLKRLADLTRTPHVLLVQWDGYVINPLAWDARFLDYDYIGARWPWHRDGMTVGNGGFSLRSRRLLETTADQGFGILPEETEDNMICRSNRRTLETKHGVRFAPEAAADAFSYERSVPARPTFGFHGLFNMWRHVDDSEMLLLMDSFSPQILSGRDFLELQAEYFLQRKFSLFGKMYGMTRRMHGPEHTKALITSLFSDAQLAKAMIDCGEFMIQSGRSDS